MSSFSPPNGAVAPAAAAPSRIMLYRRLLYAVLATTTAAALLFLMAWALSGGGFAALEFVMLPMFAVTVPWTVIGFWNAAIGLALMAALRDPVSFVTAVVRSADEEGRLA